MFYVLLALVTLGVWLFCLFDVLTIDETDVPHLPKFGWFLVVLLGFLPGALLWTVLGRPRHSAKAGIQTWPEAAEPGGRELPRGPDDDPEFLRNLDRRIHGDE